MVPGVFGDLVDGISPASVGNNFNNPQAWQHQQPLNVRLLRFTIVRGVPISRLMEENPQSNAAPPASEDAIAKLAKRNVEPTDAGTDGKAECTICVEELNIGDEVTVLPCTGSMKGV
jgi:hypothetical protein